MTRNVIASLRDFVPIRPLSRAEAMRIAELQAQRFLKLTFVTEASVPERVIAELPRVQVERISPLPVSGATHWAAQRWLIVLNGAEPLVRQRFSLAHEFKHILDHRFVDVLYSRIPAPQRQTMIEQVCDYFAGCLLMPRPWLKAAWGNGLQSLPQIAQHFGTSEAAAKVRLTQVGLISASARCGNTANDWEWPKLNPRIDRPTYSRALAKAFT
jgi:Zn-dependent peptidase ImmA (M78 family)